MTKDEVLALLESQNEKGAFEINGREYKLSPLTHQFRMKVLSVYSVYEAQILLGNYSCLADNNFQSILEKVNDFITFDGVQISKRANHWDEHPDDFLDYVEMSMKLICYPFYKGKLRTV